MIAAMRDKLIHHDFQVNWKIVWNVLTMELSPLKVHIERMLQDSHSNSPS